LPDTLGTFFACFPKYSFANYLEWRHAMKREFFLGAIVSLSIAAVMTLGAAPALADEPVATLCPGGVISFTGVCPAVPDDGPNDPGNPTVSAPEPITGALFGAGLAGLALIRRRRGK
jgi:hypothetical protein